MTFLSSPADDEKETKLREFLMLSSSGRLLAKYIVKSFSIDFAALLFEPDAYKLLAAREYLLSNPDARSLHRFEKMK